MKRDCYFLTIKTAIAGLLYNKLSNNENCNFVSNNELADYLENLAENIRTSGNSCFILNDRYRFEQTIDEISDIVIKEEYGLRLRNNISLDKIIERMFGYIPIPVIRCMDL